MVLVAATTACTPAAQCPALAPRPPGAPFLWRAQKPDGAVLWLYGTLHDGGASDVPAAAWRALEASPRFASELGDAAPDPELLDDLVHLPPGEGLDQQLPADDWYDLRDALRGRVKEAELARARPWFALTRLMNATGHSAPTSMDTALAARAKERHIAVDALESWREQMQALAGAVTLADLQDAIHARRQIGCDLDAGLAGYRAGDAGEMQARFGVDRSGQMLGPRNARWLPKLADYAAHGGAFIAVGIGHLVGEHGLVAELAARGWTVTRSM